MIIFFSNSSQIILEHGIIEKFRLYFWEMKFPKFNIKSWQSYDNLYKTKLVTICWAKYINVIFFKKYLKSKKLFSIHLNFIWNSIRLIFTTRRCKKGIITTSLFTLPISPFSLFTLSLIKHLLLSTNQYKLLLMKYFTFKYFFSILNFLHSHSYILYPRHCTLNCTWY